MLSVTAWTQQRSPPGSGHPFSKEGGAAEGRGAAGLGTGFSSEVSGLRREAEPCQAGPDAVPRTSRHSSKLLGVAQRRVGGGAGRGRQKGVAGQVSPVGYSLCLCWSVFRWGATRGAAPPQRRVSERDRVGGGAPGAAAAQAAPRFSAGAGREGLCSDTPHTAPLSPLRVTRSPPEGISLGPQVSSGPGQGGLQGLCALSPRSFNSAAPRAAGTCSVTPLGLARGAGGVRGAAVSSPLPGAHSSG